MLKSIGRITTLCAGIGIGMAIMWISGNETAKEPDANATPEKEILADEPLEVVEEISPCQSLQPADPPSPQLDTSSPPSKQKTEPEPSTSPISLPYVFHELIYGSRQGIGFEHYHEIFKTEPRDESWAGTMEAAIDYYLDATDYDNWAGVEYLECRSRTCELAGFQIGREHHHSELISAFMKSGIWQGLGPYTTAITDGEGLTRFLMFFTEYSPEELQSKACGLHERYHLSDCPP